MPFSNNTREDFTHGHHQIVNTEIRVIKFFVAKNGEALYSHKEKKKKKPGADCGSDHQLLIAKSRIKLKELWKITRPSRYNLNQILYDYTVDGMDRFKGLDLVDRVHEYLRTKVCNIV